MGASCVLHNNDRLITFNRKHFCLSIDGNIYVVVVVVGKMKDDRVGWRGTINLRYNSKQRNDDGHTFKSIVTLKWKIWTYKNLKCIFHFNAGLDVASSSLESMPVLLYAYLKEKCLLLYFWGVTSCSLSFYSFLFFSLSEARLVFYRIAPFCWLVILFFLNKISTYY